VEDDPRVCPHCQEWIEPDMVELHLAGLDGTKPECSHQDLHEIVKRATAAERLHPWTPLWRGRVRW
jgi:hypothetical protein